MDAALYLNISESAVIKLATVSSKGILFYLTAEEHWITMKPQYDTHTMAMVLVDILHEQKLINDATYRKIHMKYKK